MRFISSRRVCRGPSDGLLFFRASRRNEVHCWIRLYSMNTSTIWTDMETHRGELKIQKSAYNPEKNIILKNASISTKQLLPVSTALTGLTQWMKKRPHPCWKRTFIIIRDRIKPFMHCFSSSNCCREHQAMLTATFAAESASAGRKAGDTFPLCYMTAEVHRCVLMMSFWLW